MQDLKNKHKNQTVWIIGKGPSLEHLTREDIGEGPVITLNHAIIAVEPLNLSNPVYSMQKDGGTRRKRSPANGGYNLSPDCDYRNECGVECGLTIPKKATLLFHDLESKYCLPDHPDRYVLNLKELGLPQNVFSLIFAIKAARYMGCNNFKFISCDAHAIGAMGSYTPGKGVIEFNYAEQIGQLKSHLIGIPHEFITPGRWDKESDFAFGCMVNNPYRFNTVLKKSALPGDLHYIINPESATKGLNTLLELMEKDGARFGVLVHQDMYLRNGWLQKVKDQIDKLPESWVVAGIIGKDMEGRLCGKLHDMRIVENINTGDIHSFPEPACCFDECVIIVNLKKGFRFDERLDGFDLYGTLCVLQAWEAGGTAWVIDAWAEHYCMRPFSWKPGDDFKERYTWLYNRYKDKFEAVDSTVFVSRPRFETSAAA